MEKGEKGCGGDEGTPPGIMTAAAGTSDPTPSGSSSSSDTDTPDFSTRLRQAISLYRTNTTSSPSLQNAARCVPVQNSTWSYSYEEEPEDIATFKVNSLKLLDKVVTLYSKEKERSDELTSEISNLRGSLYTKDREVEDLQEQLSLKSAREQEMIQENQRLRRQLEMLLRIGPTRHRELMSTVRGPPHVPPPPLVKGQQQKVQVQKSLEMRSYPSFAMRRFGRASDSPPKLLPAVSLQRRPASDTGNFYPMEWNGLGNGEPGSSSPDENEDDGEAEEDETSSEDDFDDGEDVVASTTSGIAEEEDSGLIEDALEGAAGTEIKSNINKRGRPRKNQSWLAHYATHPMLQLSCKNLSKRPRPSPPPEVTSSADRDTPSRRKKKKPLQEIVDRQAKNSNTPEQRQSPLASPTRRKSTASAPKSVIFINELEQCMTTKTAYRLSLMEDRINELLKAQEAEESRNEGNVEVPAWRIKVYEPIFDPSPYPEIEDVCEAVFLKRHQRLEVDEKRRKRWDSQRAREETYLDRLKRRIDEREKQKAKRRKAAAGRKLNIERQSTNGKGIDGERGGKAKGGHGDGGSDDEMSSVHPKPEDIRFIRVGDDIPISMFGVPLPIISQKKFDLPWRPNRLLVTRKSNPSTVTSPSSNGPKSPPSITKSDRSPLPPPLSLPMTLSSPSPPPLPLEEDNSTDTTEESSSSSVSSLPSLPSPTVEPHLVKSDSFGELLRNASKLPSSSSTKDPFDFDDDQDLQEETCKSILRKDESKISEADRVTSSVQSPADKSESSHKVFTFHSPTR